MHVLREKNMNVLSQNICCPQTCRSQMKHQSHPNTPMNSGRTSKDAQNRVASAAVSAGRMRSDSRPERQRPGLRGLQTVWRSAEEEENPYEMHRVVGLVFFLQKVFKKAAQRSWTRNKRSQLVWSLGLLKPITVVTRRWLMCATKKNTISFEQYRYNCDGVLHTVTCRKDKPVPHSG